MRKAFLLTTVAAAGLTLAACGESARNETAEAAESVEGDGNAMAEAVDDLEAAQEDAFAAAENAYATTSNTVANAADDAGDAIDAAGDELE